MKRIFTVLFLILLCFSKSFTVESSEKEIEEDFMEYLNPVSIEENQGDSEIIIESVTPRLEVYLNGVYQGKTKLKIQNLLPGVYVIKLQKNGEEKGKYFITVKKDLKETFRIE